MNSSLATVLHTADTTYFVKGLRRDHPRVRAHNKEAVINPYVTPLAPRLLWRVDADGWRLLGFEHVSGRIPNYAPQSPDLDILTDAINRVSATPPPAIPFVQLPERLRDYATDRQLRTLRGDALLHTDLNPHNILITRERTHILDWAMATTGPAWCEPAFAILRLIHAGHTPHQAEQWAIRFPQWRTTPPEAITLFATLMTRLWQHFATSNPAPWRTELATHAHTWHTHRTTHH
ncbi:phosphotransferase [Spiractinospora alimapuensis]|uniref:phosphotransferase n=1 Tax=Spiractinospora alimapuensis TaxID=2820884 RepID=UPI001F2DBCD1|nr:phosphotransferase [Spiractinospora alimapuensis]QVQ54173.1 phosphotransferase [Spiractinospora alimapuensis]